MSDPSANGPSGWWGIVLSLLALLLTGYHEWNNNWKWKAEEKRRSAADEQAKKPKLKVTYLPAERISGPMSDYSFPRVKIENVGNVSATNLTFLLLFTPNTPKETQIEIRARFTTPNRLDAGTDFQASVFLGVGGSIFLTLVIKADLMDEIRWEHDFKRS
jgi:hypothetical protein